MGESPAFAANITTLFTEVPFLDRFAAAAAAGFAAVECQLPYAYAVDEIRRRLDAHGLRLVLHNLLAGDWAAGERGMACHPGRVAEFEAGVGQAIAYATALGCPRVNCLAGLLPFGVGRAEAHATLVANLRHAAPRLADAGVALVVEAINTHDVPGFLLARADDAVDAIRDAAVDNVLVQFDAYHAVTMGDDPSADVTRLGAMVGHVQIADAPGRHEPGTGGVDFPRFFAALDAAGYQGWIGCEYNPMQQTEDGLGWMAPYLPERRTR